MIVDYGIKKFKLALLKFPGDIREMMEQPHVQELAKSIEDFGMLNPLIVRRRGKRSKEIIAGRNRAAACLILNRQTVDCRVVECTDLEAELIEMAENAHRRHSGEERNFAMEKLVDLHVQWLQEQADADPMEISKITGQPIRKKVSRSEGYKQVARTLGMKVESVKGAEQKEKRKRRGGKKAQPGVKTLGMEVSEPFQVGVRAIQRLVTDIDWYLRECVKKLTKLDKVKIGFPQGISERIRGEVQQTGQLIRGFSPTHLCPYCKGLAGYQENCVACHACGWVGKDVIDRCPEELLNEDDPAILVQGTLHKVSDIVGYEVNPGPEQDEIDDLWGDEI